MASHPRAVALRELDDLTFSIPASVVMTSRESPAIVRFTHPDLPGGELTLSTVTGPATMATARTRFDAERRSIERTFRGARFLGPTATFVSSRGSLEHYGGAWNARDGSRILLTYGVSSARATARTKIEGGPFRTFARLPGIKDGMPRRKAARAALREVLQSLELRPFGDAGSQSVREPSGASKGFD